MKSVCSFEIYEHNPLRFFHIVRRVFSHPTTFTMSRFFHGGGSDSESSSSEEEELYSDREESSEEEEGGEGGSDDEESSSEEESSGEEEESSSGEEEGGASQFLKDVPESDESEDEERVTVVKSAKDKRLEELEGTVKLIENAEKINDWAVISTGALFRN